MMRVLIMRPEAPNEGADLDLKPNASFDELRKAIEPITGEPMEHVLVLADFAGGTDFRPSDMFVNELGHIRVGIPPLPRNENATVIYRRNALLYQGVTDPEELPWIAGPAVLFEKRIWR